ncbi:MAG: thiamine phosphate synthase [Acidobacteriota bacterium]|jgi:thiamine-phosphate pyrophosphorylase|nr:thiamine phosphate synthase [Acidobacteriota bacterium]NLT34204.1 thiamine phosphate synthase [Acidobacteriota bacterium]
MKTTPPPIYPITDKVLARKTTHLAVLRELARGGATFVQIRDKTTPAGELLGDLSRCVEFALERGITIIVDDRCDLALAAGAQGVHLGREDLPPEAGRRLLGPGAIVGYSTHTLGQVRQSRSLPIDYIGFGPVFPTTTKDRPDPVVGLGRLAAACRESAFPVVAIGGIGLDQVAAALDAGATSVAVISALMGAPDLAREMERFLRATGR